jgi:exopolysaccharide biosynthesis polyprenyl glycosylphosphotransferase
VPVIWVGAMLVARSYEERFLWVGPEEFRRIFFAAMMLLATLGTVSWAFRLDVARGFVIVAVPLAASLTMAQRYTQRQLLHRARGRGQHLQTTVLVGHRNAVAALDEQIDREAYHGYRVIGCCLPADQYDPGADAFNGLPVLGNLQEVADVVARFEVDTVAVLPCPELDGPALRRLGWALEKTRAELLLAPAVTEIVGTRVRIRPVSGLPLMHMERPELTGVRRLTKDLFDKTAATFGVVFLLPVLLGLALAVKITSCGPVFFRQERVGRDGQTFAMLKFRSMVVGADRMVDDLADESDGNGVLFKKKDDPRVTRVGKVLRRYSLDELPQLINVVRGDMSLVGPRPPLQSEVERYGYDMHRRFLVKPGLTGLWQVSGRSDLSWDDSVRIDVRYVENWSLTFDFMILWKTAGAVLRGSGAY